MLNEKTIGKVFGFNVKIYDEKSLFKNKFLKTEISQKAKSLLEEYTKKLINDKNLNISIDAGGDLFFNFNKIGYLCKGNSILSPKVIVNNNNYLWNQHI